VSIGNFRTHWRDLLFSILSNPRLPLDSTLAKLVCHSLMRAHFPSADDTAEAIHEFCDAINAFMPQQLPRGSSAARGSSIGIDSSISMSPAVDGGSSSNSGEAMDEPGRRRALTIINAMLRTGRFNQSSVELQGVSEAIVSIYHSVSSFPSVYECQ
jgi:hypothetical protein